MKHVRFLVLSVAALTLCATTMQAQSVSQTSAEGKVLYLLDGKVVDQNTIANFPDHMIKDINVIENIESVVMIKTYGGEVIDRINGGSGYVTGANQEYIEVYLDFAKFKPQEYIGDKYVVRVDMSKPFPEHSELEPVKSQEEQYYDTFKYDANGKLYINQEAYISPNWDIEPTAAPEGIEPIVQIYDKEGNRVNMDIRDITPDMIGSMSVFGPGANVVVDGKLQEAPAGVVFIHLK